MSRTNDVWVVEGGLMVSGGFRHEDITGYYNRVDDIKQADEQRIRHEFGKNTSMRNSLPEKSAIGTMIYTMARYLRIMSICIENFSSENIDSITSAST